jgi:hypothetical protein
MPTDPFVDIGDLSSLGLLRYLDVRDQAAFDAGHAPRAVRADAGGAQAHRLPVGAFIHRQMAESPDADGGREPDRARERDAAGRGHQPGLSN